MGSVNYNLFDVTNTNIGKEYLFKDITVPIGIKGSGKDIRQSIDINAIENSLRNIFSWAKGERIIRPEFGESFRQYLYEPISDTTAENIRTGILDTFETWEPRVTIVSVSVEPLFDQNQYNVSVTYSIPSLDDKVYRFRTIFNKI